MKILQDCSLGAIAEIGLSVAVATGEVQAQTLIEKWSRTQIPPLPPRSGKFINSDLERMLNKRLAADDPASLQAYATAFKSRTGQQWND